MSLCIINSSSFILLPPCGASKTLRSNLLVTVAIVYRSFTKKKDWLMNLIDPMTSWAPMNLEGPIGSMDILDTSQKYVSLAKGQLAKLLKTAPDVGLNQLQSCWFLHPKIYGCPQGRRTGPFHKKKTETSFTGMKETSKNLAREASIFQGRGTTSSFH